MQEIKIDYKDIAEQIQQKAAALIGSLVYDVAVANATVSTLENLLNEQSQTTSEQPVADVTAQRVTPKKDPE